MEVLGWIIGIGAVLGVIIWLLSRKGESPSDITDYAVQSRDNVNRSIVGTGVEIWDNRRATHLAASRQGLAQALNALHQAEGAAKTAKAENDLALTRHSLAHELELLQHNFKQETVKYNTQITEQAGKEGRTLETDQAVKLKEGESQIKIKEEEEHARIEIKKFKKMKEAELRNTLEEMRERVRLAIIADYLTEHQKIQLILEQSDLLYQQIQGIGENPALNEITKSRMINDREEFLLTLKEDRRGREDRLLQAGNNKQQGHQQVGQDTNLRGDYRQAIEAGEE
jgi:hypothetical protein